MAEQIHIILDEIVLDVEHPFQTSKREKYEKLGFAYSVYDFVPPFYYAIPCLQLLAKQFELHLYFSNSTEICQQQLKWYETKMAKHVAGIVGLEEELNSVTQGVFISNNIPTKKVASAVKIVVLDPALPDSWKKMIDRLKEMYGMAPALYDDLLIALALKTKTSDSSQSFDQMTDEERYLNSRK